MLLPKSLLLLSLVIGSLARNDFEKSHSRHVRKHSQRRQVDQTCTPRKTVGRPVLATPSDGSPPSDPTTGAQPPVQSFKRDIVYKGDDFFR